MGRATSHTVLRDEGEVVHCEKILELPVLNNEKEEYG
jgi:hypothetical protein